VPGAQVTCACTGGLIGVRRCGDDGAFGACSSCAAMDDAARLLDAAVVDAGVDASTNDAAPANDAAASDAGSDAGRLGTTGAPCTQASDCLGQSPMCLAIGNGYCTSACDPANADFTTQLDPECPGSAFCDGTQCASACTARSGAMPCPTGTACLAGAGCVPNATSMCDPTNPASCATGQVCGDFGFDPIGICCARCDPFAPACNTHEGCFVMTADGEAGCTGANGRSAGSPCLYIGDCAPGLGCHVESSGRFCRTLCGGPGARTCASGTCVDYSATISLSVVGVCVP
jgi:hypothetical protein